MPVFRVSKPVRQRRSFAQIDAYARQPSRMYLIHNQPGLDESKSLELSGSEVASEFPSVYFLDHDVFRQSNVVLPPVDMPLDPVLAEGIQDSALITTRYFAWVHLWMPIIYKSRFLLDRTGPLAKPRSDVKILLFCMKLIMWSPTEGQLQRQPRSRDYFAAKKAFLSAEAAGLLSFQLLQAQVLMAIYEYSQAIYPAAYLTLGICVRYGLALGIDKQCKDELESASFDLEDQEERRRVWWAIVIIDRVLSHWSPTSPDPRPGDLLPVNDQAWDDGIIDPSCISPVSSPAKTNMGMFARLSQAAYLLGRVQRNKNFPTGDSQFDTEERTQLDRSLRSLLNLTYQEGATHQMPICPQTTICYTALIKLHSLPQLPAQLASSIPGAGHANLPLNPSYKVPEADVRATAETLNTLRPVAQESLLTAKLFFRSEPWSMEKSSPLLLHSTYSAAVAFLKVNRCLHLAETQYGDSLTRDFQMWDLDEMKREAARGFQTMKLKLTLLGKQWSAADEYLRILDAREIGKMI